MAIAQSELDDAAGPWGGHCAFGEFPRWGCQLEHDNKNRWCVADGRCGGGGPHAGRRWAGRVMASPPPALWLNPPEITVTERPQSRRICHRNCHRCGFITGRAKRDRSKRTGLRIFLLLALDRGWRRRTVELTSWLLTQWESPGAASYSWKRGSFSTGSRRPSFGPREVALRARD